VQSPATVVSDVVVQCSRSLAEQMNHSILLNDASELPSEWSEWSDSKSVSLSWVERAEQSSFADDRDPDARSAVLTADDRDPDARSAVLTAAGDGLN
jgi:hypothetical protein